jgi:hypothetical protein
MTVGPFLWTRFLHSCCLAVGIVLFVLLQAKQRSMEHTEASPVFANKSNVWAMSTEYSWSDNRKTKVFGEKFIPVSLSSTHGRACNLTRRFAASNFQSRGASCFCSTWVTKIALCGWRQYLIVCVM